VEELYVYAQRIIGGRNLIIDTGTVRLENTVSIIELSQSMYDWATNILDDSMKIFYGGTLCLCSANHQ